MTCILLVLCIVQPMDYYRHIFCNIFVTNNYVHVHDIRLSNCLHKFGHTKNILRYTVRIFGTFLWNSLNADLRNISATYLFISMINTN